jgi:hypothetical protein
MSNSLSMILFLDRFLDKAAIMLLTGSGNKKEKQTNNEVAIKDR